MSQLTKVLIFHWACFFFIPVYIWSYICGDGVLCVSMEYMPWSMWMLRLCSMMSRLLEPGCPSVYCLVCQTICSMNFQWFSCPHLPSLYRSSRITSASFLKFYKEYFTHCTIHVACILCLFNGYKITVRFKFFQVFLHGINFLFHMECLVVKNLKIILLRALMMKLFTQNEMLITFIEIFGKKITLSIIMKIL